MGRHMGTGTVTVTGTFFLWGGISGFLPNNFAQGQVPQMEKHQTCIHIYIHIYIYIRTHDMLAHPEKRVIFKERFEPGTVPGTTTLKWLFQLDESESVQLGVSPNIHLKLVV